MIIVNKPLTAEECILFHKIYHIAISPAEYCMFNYMQPGAACPGSFQSHSQISSLSWMKFSVHFLKLHFNFSHCFFSHAHSRTLMLTPPSPILACSFPPLYTSLWLLTHIAVEVDTTHVPLLSLSLPHHLLLSRALSCCHIPVVQSRV